MNPLDWSLVDGWLPAVFTAAGLAALTALVLSGRRSRWTRLARLGGVASRPVHVAALVG